MKVPDGAVCWHQGPTWCNVLIWRFVMVQCVEIKVSDDAICWQNAINKALDDTTYWCKGPWCNMLVQRSMMIKCVDAKVLGNAMCWCKSPYCNVLKQMSLMMQCVDAKFLDDTCVDAKVLDDEMCWQKALYAIKSFVMWCVDTEVLNDAMRWHKGPWWCNVLMQSSLMQCVELKVLDAMCWSEGPWCNVLRWRSLMQWVDIEDTDGVMVSYKSILNSLWPCEVMCHHRSGSTLSQEIACCLIVA